MLELTNGVLWALVFLRAPQWPELLGGVFFASACLALAAIDLEFQILPDRITLTGIVPRHPPLFFSKTRTPGSALLGAAVGGEVSFSSRSSTKRSPGRRGWDW
jgi:prepilin signal peptidase PulO-like enzyme (type II secretory pathway)